MAPQIPTPGRIVNFVRNNPRTGAKDIRPMIIVMVGDGDEQRVNGVVTIDGTNDAPPGPNGEIVVHEWATSVPYERVPDRPDAEPTPGTWHWPARQ